MLCRSRSEGDNDDILLSFVDSVAGENMQSLSETYNQLKFYHAVHHYTVAKCLYCKLIKY